MRTKLETLVFETVAGYPTALIFFNAMGAYIIDYGCEGFDLFVVEGTSRDWDISANQHWQGLSEQDMRKLLLELMNLN